MLSHQEGQALEAEIPYLRRFARARVRDPQYADDLVQACLEKAIINMDKYHAGTNLRAWLLTILRNHQISDYRKQKRRPDMVSYDELTCARPDDAKQLDGIAFKDFAKLFSDLPDSDQEILLLVGAEGLSYEEAAEVLDIAVGTVRSRLSRARTKLKALQDEADRPKSERIRLYGRTYGAKAPGYPNVVVHA